MIQIVHNRTPWYLMILKAFIPFSWEEWTVRLIAVGICGFLPMTKFSGYWLGYVISWVIFSMFDLGRAIFHRIKMNRIERKVREELSKKMILIQSEE